MANIKERDELRVECANCGYLLVPDQQFCPGCGTRNNVVLEKTNGSLTVKVEQAEYANLPVPYSPKLPAVDFSADSTLAKSTLSLLPYIPPEMRLAVSEAFIANERDLLRRAREADTTAFTAITLGGCVGASLFTGAIMAAATAPITLPIAVLGGVGFLTFGFGITINLDAKKKRDEYSDLREALADARRRHLDGR